MESICPGGGYLLIYRSQRGGPSPLVDLDTEDFEKRGV